MKKFNGKAIYEPSGKAAEYSPWACNFYTGCSNDCDYCYCKRGVMAPVWDTKPHLKKCFVNPKHAIEVFCRELDVCAELIGERGLLFSFTTDPLLPETRDLTFEAMEETLLLNIPVKVLTKRADWLDEFFRRTEIEKSLYSKVKSLIAFGFTLTGADDLEPGASTNNERIYAMRKLHEMGFKTFASIEPVINPCDVVDIFLDTYEYCDLYKVGLISGKGKDFYDRQAINVMWEWLQEAARKGYKIYPKDSLLAYMGVNRAELKYFVDADYNIFSKEG